MHTNETGTNINDSYSNIDEKFLHPFVQKIITALIINLQIREFKLCYGAGSLVSKT